MEALSVRCTPQATAEVLRAQAWVAYLAPLVSSTGRQQASATAQDMWIRACGETCMVGAVPHGWKKNSAVTGTHGTTMGVKNGIMLGYFAPPWANIMMRGECSICPESMVFQSEVHTCLPL